jgi:hypothetical protein
LGKVIARSVATKQSQKTLRYAQGDRKKLRVIVEIGSLRGAKPLFEKNPSPSLVREGD